MKGKKGVEYWWFVGGFLGILVVGKGIYESQGFGNRFYLNIYICIIYEKFSFIFF